LGYSEEDIVEMLKPGGDYTQELPAKIVQITGVFTPFFLSGTKISMARY
jgi:hypothetical protein